MHGLRIIGCAALLALLSFGCATTTPTPQTPRGTADEVDLKGAVTYIASDLTMQLGTARPRSVAVDPLLDKTTGQQTNASLRAQTELVAALSAASSRLTIEPLGQRTAEQMGLVATGTIATADAPGRYLMNVAITDRVNGLVVAQSAVRFTQADLDQAPTAFYRDSPSLVRDRTVEGYVKTAETPAGRLADPLYVEQLPTEALMATALDEYNAARYDTALTAYTAASNRQNGQTLRTFNGLYLTNMRLGRTAAAEEAFAKIAALGLATNNLAVKLLFRPGTTDFLADPSFGGAYPMWIRQIARAAQAAQTCLNVVGNTSSSGTVATNDRLSVARASYVQMLLEREVPGLTRRLRATGVGSQRNIVGTGVDDASDAIDRRVEFEVESCTR